MREVANDGIEPDHRALRRGVPSTAPEAAAALISSIVTDRRRDLTIPRNVETGSFGRMTIQSEMLPDGLRDRCLTLAGERGFHAGSITFHRMQYPSLDLHPGGLHHVAPFGALGLGVIGEFIRGGGSRLGADGLQGLDHVGQFPDPIDLG